MKSPVIKGDIPVHPRGQLRALLGQDRVLSLWDFGRTPVFRLQFLPRHIDAILTLRGRYDLTDHFTLRNALETVQALVVHLPPFVLFQAHILFSGIMIHHSPVLTVDLAHAPGNGKQNAVLPARCDGVYLFPVDAERDLIRLQGLHDTAGCDLLPIRDGRKYTHKSGHPIRRYVDIAFRIRRLDLQGLPPAVSHCFLIECLFGHDFRSLAFDLMSIQPFTQCREEKFDYFHISRVLFPVFPKILQQRFRRPALLMDLRLSPYLLGLLLLQVLFLVLFLGSSDILCFCDSFHTESGLDLSLRLRL